MRDKIGTKLEREQSKRILFLEKSLTANTEALRKCDKLENKSKQGTKSTSIPQSNMPSIAK